MKLTIKFLKAALDQALILCDHEELHKIVEESKLLPPEQQYFPELISYVIEQMKNNESPKFKILVFGVEEVRKLLFSLTDLPDSDIETISKKMDYNIGSESVEMRSNLFMYAKTDNRLAELYELINAKS